MGAGAAGLGAIGDIGSIIQGGFGTGLRVLGAAGYGAGAGQRQDTRNATTNQALSTMGGLTQYFDDRLGDISQEFIGQTTPGQDNWTALGGPRNIGDINDPNRAAEVGGRMGIAMQGYQEVMARGEADINRVMQQGETAFSEFTKIANQGIGEFKNYVADGVATYMADSDEAMENLKGDLDSAMAQGAMTPQAAFMYQRNASRQMAEKAQNATRSLTLQAGSQAANLYMQKASGLAQLRSQFAGMEAGVRGDVRGNQQNAIGQMVAAFDADESSTRAWADRVQQIKREQSAERYAAQMSYQSALYDDAWRNWQASEDVARFFTSQISGVASDIQGSAGQWSTMADNFNVRRQGAQQQDSGGMF